MLDHFSNVVLKLSLAIVCKHIYTYPIALTCQCKLLRILLVFLFSLKIYIVGTRYEYPQSMCLSNSEKIMLTPVIPVLLHKSGVKVVLITRSC